MEEQRQHEKPGAPAHPLELTAEESRTITKPPTPGEHGEQGISVRGESGMLVRFAKCCSPLPGDEIVGYITRGRGVTVHIADCINIISEIETDRLVPVSWIRDTKSSFSGSIQIIAYDREGLLADLMQVITSLGVTISTISAKSNKKDQTCFIAATLEVENSAELNKIIKQLSKRTDVVRVYRVGS
jgi:GTP pyrophosphokinase